jgi:Eukaryotic translation initiation factor 3 subunit 7 (eIF-3)
VNHQLLFNHLGRLLKRWIFLVLASSLLGWAKNPRICKYFVLLIRDVRLTYPSNARITCGELEYYDKQYDRVTVKNERRLMRIDRIFHKVTTTDDPVIRKVIGSTSFQFYWLLINYYYSSWPRQKAMFMLLIRFWLHWCAASAPITAGILLFRKLVASCSLTSVTIPNLVN